MLQDSISVNARFLAYHQKVKIAPLVDVPLDKAAVDRQRRTAFSQALNARMLELKR